MGVFACRHGGGFREAECCFPVFVDVDAGREGLVRQAFSVGVGGLVEAMAVDQEA